MCLAPMSKLHQIFADNPINMKNHNDSGFAELDLQAHKAKENANHESNHKEEWDKEEKGATLVHRTISSSK